MKPSQYKDPAVVITMRGKCNFKTFSLYPRDFHIVENCNQQDEVAFEILVYVYIAQRAGNIQ